MIAPLESSVCLPVGLREGDVVGGRYRIEQVIGKGGMGVVVAAHHLELEGRVAIKFLSPEALAAPEAVSRFDREIRAAARLTSEHVARVYDAGKLADGSRYMVLEFLDGEDLARRVRRLGPLEPTLAVRFLLQACTAVLEAHGLGIVHRDLKPANLFVIQRADGAEIVKVLDFGVMKRLAGTAVTTEPEPTEPGTIIGTPLYTSPEQLRGSATVDARSDIWSLGVTLFELLTGVPPFGGKTYAQVIANVLEAEPASLQSVGCVVGAELEAVCRQCLEKDPALRFENVADLALALAATVELDAEQQGLLERMVRHQLVSSPFASSGAQTPLGAGGRLPEGFGPAVIANHSVAKRGAQARLLFVSAVAIVTAAAVLGLGLPYLPHFGRSSRPGAAATAAGFSQPLFPRESTPLSPPAVPAPSAERTETPTPVQKSTIAGSVRKSVRPSTAKATSAETVGAMPSAEPIPQKKNPLLVRPK